MMHALFDLIMTSLCLYIVYRNNPLNKRENAIWLLLCLSFGANTAASLFASYNHINIEHYAVSIGILFKFFSLRSSLWPKII